MTDPNRPSYDPHATLGGLDAELQRLEEQAAIAWGEESRLLGELGIGRAATVLEVGCGPGALLGRIATIAPNAQLIGIDYDPELLEHARARPELAAAELREGDAYDLPLLDDSVDFVVVRVLLQHLSDPVRALREMRRVLRPGGTIATVEVDGELWGIVQPRVKEIEAVQAKVWRSQEQRGGDRFTGRKLYRLLTEAGFADASVRPYAYHSDELGLEAFDAILSAEAIAPSLADGTITPTEFSAVAAGHRRFRDDPDAFVMLIGLLACATVPAREANA
jgi:ubiquinone/menaquinone biosynthesis C-methylase UbiE